MGKNTWVFWGVLGLLTAGCGTSRKTPALYGTDTVPPAANGVSASTELPFVIRAVSQDPTYGYTAQNPVRVGGGCSAGVRNQRRYLNALKGTEGQDVTFEHQASCCPLKKRGGVMDNPEMLDVYAVTWMGKSTPVTLYINMYKGGKLVAPQGFNAAR